MKTQERLVVVFTPTFGDPDFSQVVFQSLKGRNLLLRLAVTGLVSSALKKGKTPVEDGIYTVEYEYSKNPFSYITGRIYNGIKD